MDEGQQIGFLVTIERFRGRTVLSDGSQEARLVDLRLLFAQQFRAVGLGEACLRFWPGGHDCSGSAGVPDHSGSRSER